MDEEVKTEDGKTEAKPNKTEAKPNKTEGIMDYQKFLDLEKNPSYFLTASPFELMALAPKVRQFLLDTLSERPHEEEELYALMERKNPLLSQAFGYIQEQVDYDGENFEACRNALEMIVDGIEVRIDGDQNNYFGLKSKLDSC